ncbi:polysaccharide lyase-domain-containing protein [Thelonectria olida]|uniref:Polysaccharide lyase-domain-containing protein n=1 Tax=Thelonectria olida TaxID=1576542 RepID=A0A9P9AHL2_9HYPO|nr:polysaccharide lyase-domain-containing protein [Thelonectria olida]
MSSISIFLAILILAGHAAAWKGNSNTTALRAHNFDDLTLGPFDECNAKKPSYVQASSGNAFSGTGKMTMYFDETDFDGTRNDKGAELCCEVYGQDDKNVIAMYKEGWQGFAVYVPSSTFPDNKNGSIAQQFCPGGCSSWCGLVTIESNSLTVDHRTYCGDPTHAVVVEDIERDTWHTIVVRFRVSHAKDGAYELWYDGKQVYSATGVNVGFGTWDADADELSTGFYFKNGLYAHGEFEIVRRGVVLAHIILTQSWVDTENYNDETRTLYFDHVSWYRADDGETDGYATVKP